VIAAALACTLVVIVCSRRSYDRPVLVAAGGAIWCVLAAAPAIGYLFIGPDLEGSRYLYLPAVGWALFLAAALDVSATTRAAIAVHLLIVVVTATTLYSHRMVASQWREAALLRDRLISDGLTLIAATPCNVTGAEGLPSRHGGAQLFNNGYVEAVRGRTSDALSGPNCKFIWTGERLVVQTSESAASMRTR
jgi:hypothetical protein